MTTKHKSEPFWINEPDWLCAVEFLNDEDTEGRDIAADTIGYLWGYARLTNTRSLALLGDPSAEAYEILFSFSTPDEKARFRERYWVRFTDCSWETTTSTPTLTSADLWIRNP